jgi:hypothetical protein
MLVAHVCDKRRQMNDVARKRAVVASLGEVAANWPV